MFKRNVPIKKYFAVTSMFILMGFFACVVHIVPQSHHVTDSHAEHDTNQVACVDHQVSSSLSHRDRSDSIQIAILPQTNIQPTLVSNLGITYSDWVKLYPPPNKTALYIKNNTFLI